MARKLRFPTFLVAGAFALLAALSTTPALAAIATLPVVRSHSNAIPVSASAVICVDLTGTYVGCGSGGSVTASFSPWTPDATGTKTIASVSTTSSNVALVGSPSAVTWVTNTGSVSMWVKLGSTSGVTATVGDTLVLPNSSVSLNTGTGTYIAAITSTGTTSLSVQTGTGDPSATAGGGASGGGGGAVTQSGTWTVGLSAGANTVGTVNLGTLNGASTAANQATEITSLASIATNTGTPGTTPCASSVTACDMNARLAKLEAAAEDTTTASLVKLDQTTPGTTNNVSVSPVAGGGCTVVGIQSAASNNANFVKASAATLCGGLAINVTGTLEYLRLYNLTAAPTCSSATGFVATIPIPASTTGAGTLINLGAFGGAFPTGLAYCITGGGTSTDNTSAAVGVFITLAYK